MFTKAILSYHYPGLVHQRQLFFGNPMVLCISHFLSTKLSWSPGGCHRQVYCFLVVSLEWLSELAQGRSFVVLRVVVVPLGVGVVVRVPVEVSL